MLFPISPSALALLAGVLYSLLAITVWVIVRRGHTTPQVDQWSLGTLVICLGVVLLAAGPTLPAWAGMPLAHAALFGGTLLRWAALRSVLGLPLRWRSLALLWLACLGIYLLWLALQQTWLRVLYALLVLTLGSAVLAWLAGRLARQLHSRGARALAFTEVLMVAGLLQRLVAVAGGWAPPTALDNSPSFWTLALTMVVAALYGNLGFLGMELDRLGSAQLQARRAELEEVARREAAEHSAAELRAALEQRDRLAAERDQLLQMLAHEIRQPLHNASGALQAAALLVQAAPAAAVGAAEGPAAATGTGTAGEAGGAVSGAVSDQVSGRLLRAQAVLGDVRSVLDNTLAAALMLTRREPLVVQDMDLHLLAHLVLGDLPENQRQRVRVEWYTPLRSAELEPGMVRLALRNLVRNAFEHGGPDVQVALRVEEQAQPAAVVLTVADNGQGQLGPRLEDGGAPPAPPHAGAPEAVRRGLGLVIVRRVMALHHGQLVLAPNWPRGLQARLVFPDPSDEPAGDSATGPRR